MHCCAIGSSLVAIIHTYLLLNLHQPSNGQEFSHKNSHHNDAIFSAIKNTTLCQSFGGSIAIGMESGHIPDNAITASSSYNQQSVGPQNARLNRELSGGAWCPSRQLSAINSGKEWIQVNLTDRFVITGIATQGRFGNGMGVEFTEQYWIEYTRDNGKTWNKWRNKNGIHELVGNEDTYSIVDHELQPPLVAITAIRVMPVSQYMRTCCLRLELYGCPYKDGPISYSTNDGQYGGRFGDLVDMTYDGHRSESGFLSGGLGQLIDGYKGDDNYKVNKGYEWIGWKVSNSNNNNNNNNINSNNYVSIILEFEDIRNFTLASFHCNNIFTKEIQVFSSAKVWFSLDARKWSQVPEDFEYMPDLVMERSRDVVIHLHHRIGRFIKFDLKYASKWILISEVRIDSQAVSSNLIISDLDLDHNALKPLATQTIHNNRSLIRESVLLIVFSVFGLIITISIVLYIIHTRPRKDKLSGSEYVTMPMKDVATTPLYCEPQDVKRVSPFSGSDPEYAVPDVIGGSPPTTTTFMHTNKSRYYASADVLNRANYNDFDNYHYASTANANSSAYHGPNNPVNNCVKLEASIRSNPLHEPPLPLRKPSYTKRRANFY